MQNAARRGQVPACGRHWSKSAPCVCRRVVSLRRVQIRTRGVVPSEGVDRPVGAQRRSQAHARRRHGGNIGPGIGV